MHSASWLAPQNPWQGNDEVHICLWTCGVAADLLIPPWILQWVLHQPKMHSSRSTLSARSVIAFSLITLADNMINLVATYGG